MAGLNGDAVRLQLTVRRGADFRWGFRWEDEDTGEAFPLAGATATMEVRAGTPDAPGAVVLDLDSGGGGGITLDPDATDPDPMVSVTITAAQADELTAGASYCYDLHVVDSDGVEWTPFAGPVLVRERVTG